MSKTKPMYYVYHIPKIKVGMTKDLGDRVFEQQGYEPARSRIALCIKRYRSSLRKRNRIPKILWLLL